VYTAESIRASMKKLNIQIKHNNSLTRGELILQLVASGSAQSVLEDMKASSHSEEVMDLVLEDLDEVVDAEPKEEGEEAKQEEIKEEVKPVVNKIVKGQPSAQAIKQAMRVAGIKIPVVEKSTES
jgi:methyltransferase-like protein